MRWGRMGWRGGGFRMIQAYYIYCALYFYYYDTSSTSDHQALLTILEAGDSCINRLPPHGLDQTWPCSALFTSGSQTVQQCFRSLQHSWVGDVLGERLLTQNILRHVHKAKFSPAAVDTGSLICHLLVVTPHLLSPACRQASPTPPGIA